MPPQKKPDAQALQWVTINDFSPGIYSKMRGFGSNATPAPLGAAQETNTYRCICLPTGGLAPGPKKIADWTLPAPETNFNFVKNGYRLVGFYPLSPARVSATSGTSTYPDELVCVIEWITSAAHPTQANKKGFTYRRARVYDPNYGTDSLSGVSYSAQVLPTTDIFWGVSMGSTRSCAATDQANPTDAEAARPGHPIAVWNYWTQGAASESTVLCYPNPANAATLAPVAVQNISALPANVVLHQNRIVLLFFSDWVGPSLIRRTNDQAVFTDPPNTIAVPTSQVNQGGTQFGGEEPTGFGAWGSISTTSLFLIKARGGATIVSGDLNDPVITPVPGVASTGSNISHAVTTAHGLFYIGSDDGCWVWRGSDSAQKVSIQLDDGVFRMMSDQASVNFHFAEWGDWVLVSNNWLYDTLTGGWWKIENDNPTTDPISFPLQGGIWNWQRGYRGNHMYGSELTYSNGYLTPIHTWDKNQSATNYSWQSQPLHESESKLITVREVEILAQGTGRVTVTFTALDGSISASNVFTFTQTTQPQLFRTQVGAVGGGAFENQYISMRIVADGGTGSAPVIYRATIGWEESVMVAGS